MFSSRVPGELALNRLSAALATHRAAGRSLFDLTTTNPTAAGIEYAADLLAPLAGVAGLTYQPEPFGLLSARRAIAADYARRGTLVTENRIVLTASTSEAYSLLFKLLCAPSDDVLVPAPSYPLFDHLTKLDGVGARPYALEYHGRWELDDQSVDDAWTKLTRAVLAVSPNNPTGSLLSDAELDGLSARCAVRDAALIVDEVFADYTLNPFAGADGRGEGAYGRGEGAYGRVEGAGGRDEGAGRQVGSADGRVEGAGGRVEGAGGRVDGAGRRVAGAGRRGPANDALTFRLGGLSKSAGLPQVKLGWIAVDGPDSLVEAALHRLELICDTYLSVSTPVQVAASSLIARGADVREQIQRRILTNHASLRAAASADPSVELLHADGGWSVVLRVPSHHSEEDLVVGLLEERDTLVHPGFFFDFPHEAFLVVSLLPEPAIFDEGVRRVMDRVHA